MDDTTNNNSVTTNGGGGVGGGGGPAITNGTTGANSYENTLKVLIHILKLKTTDKLNKLEKLWDSINQQAIVTPPNGSTTNGTSKSPPHTLNSNLQKRDISKIDESNTDSATKNGATSNNKKFKPDTTKSMNEILGGDAIKKPPIKSSNSPPNLSTNKLTGKPLSASLNRTNNNSANKLSPINSPPSLTSSGNDSNSSSTSSTSSTSNQLKAASSSSSSSSNLLASSIKITSQTSESDDLNSVVDMLDFSCFICRQFNQELNNKLIECKVCAKLYHQMCHMPQIENFDIIELPSLGNVSGEDSSTTNSKSSNSDKSMVWYFKKCSSCATNETKQTITLPVNNKALIKSPVRSNDEDSNSSNSNVQTDSVKSNNALKFFKRGATTTNNNTTSSNESSSTSSSTQQLNKTSTTTSSTTNVKGLAAFATKFNPNQNSASTSTKPSVLGQSKPGEANSKPNHDDLFKKFKLTTSTAASASASASASSNKSLSSSAFLSANNKATQATSQQQSSTMSSSQPKRNIFNMPSSNSSIDTSSTTSTTANNLKKPSLVNATPQAQPIVKFT